MNVTFTGGGTGGHLYPAISVADALVAQAHSRGETMRISFIGAADRLEATIVPAAGYDVRFVPASSFSYANPFKRVVAAGVNIAGVLAAVPLLLSQRPDFIVASGGYVCFPVVVAARVLRALRMLSAPLALLEINAYPGLTNRMLAPLVDEVWGAFPGAAQPFGNKYHQTGIPVRPGLHALPDRANAARWLGLDPACKTILFMGGSQGARSINEAVAALVTRRALPPDWQVLHISGRRDYDYMKAEQAQLHGGNKIVLLPYLDDLSEAYAASDLVVARSGASTLGELATLALPSILVPYPHAAQDHQRINAQAFAAAGAAVILDDEKLNGDALWWSLRSALEPQNYEQMRLAARSLAPKDATGAILQRIASLLKRNTTA